MTGKDFYKASHSKAAYVKRGYGQVEPNHLSAQHTGQIYAQLPAAKDIEILENGQFVKYDYAKKVCDFTGAGEWMLVFNEIKLYDDWRETYKDFAMIRSNYTPGSDTITHGGLGPFKGQMTPRVFKTNVGDIYTTNMIDPEAEITAGTTKLTPKENGILKVAAGTEDVIWKVVKVYTMADGQAAVKLQRIK